MVEQGLGTSKYIHVNNARCGRQVVVLAVTHIGEGYLGVAELDTPI